MRKLKYIKKPKAKDAINIYDRLGVFEDKINQIIKSLNDECDKVNDGKTNE